MKYEVKPIVQTGLYRHYKGGLYEVLMVGLDSETLQQTVVYRNLEHGTVWIRNEQEFLESVEKDGVLVKRFSEIVPAENANDKD